MDLEAMSQQCQEDSIRWFGEDAASDLTVTVLGICGEAGEVADIVKKVARGSFTPAEVYKHLCEELVDVQIYLCKAFALLQVPIEEVYNAKREYNDQRFSPGLDEQVRDASTGTVGEGRH